MPYREAQDGRVGSDSGGSVQVMVKGWTGDVKVSGRGYSHALTITTS